MMASLLDVPHHKMGYWNRVVCAMPLPGNCQARETQALSYKMTLKPQDIAIAWTPSLCWSDRAALHLDHRAIDGVEGDGGCERLRADQ